MPMNTGTYERGSFMSSRFTRRAALTAGSISAVAVAAGCSSGGNATPGASPNSAGSSASAETGPIVFATGKDTSGNLQKEVDTFNKANPGEDVKVQELPDNADQQRAQMIQNAQNKSAAFTVLNVDVVWTAEFAANQYIDPLPDGVFDLTGFLPATVDSATYFKKLYCVPVTSDGGMLYYRKDWLDSAGISSPPTTWDEVKQMGDQIKSKVAAAKSADIYGGQFQKYEGLTVNFAEFVNGAGGVITGDDGKANVNTPEAKAGLQQMVDWFKDGTIPKAGLTWQEEQSRQAFQDGKLIFLRNWPYVYSSAEKTDGSSKVAGKFAVAPLPGKSGPGVSSLGGHNYAINKFAKNKGTAIKFMQFMSSEKEMNARIKATSNAPTRKSLYNDAALVKSFPYLPVLLKSIQTAKPRPKAVKYGDVTSAIQNAAYSALQGQASPADALAQLQTKLESLIKV